MGTSRSHEGEDERLRHDEASLAAAGVQLQLDRPLEAGETVGEYQIGDRIGEGGFGVVYRATHPLIGKAAAVKVLSRQLSSQPETVSRFIAEARAVNTIRHRNITDVFNFGTLPDGRLYFVMELLEGCGLDGYLQRHRVVEPSLLRRIMRGVAKALDGAHKKGIVHRDLKPENIFLHYDDDGELTPKLLDFGIAKLLGEGQLHKHLTQTGAPLGTPHYMSPEQCLGLDIDQRTDIYSFGVVCFEALTGTTPFQGKNLLDLLNQHVSADRPRVSQRSPDLGKSFDVCLSAMMAVDREERPSSAGEAFVMLDNAAARAKSTMAGLGAQPLALADTAAVSGASDSEGRPHTEPDSDEIPTETQPVLGALPREADTLTPTEIDGEPAPPAGDGASPGQAQAPQEPSAAGAAPARTPAGTMLAAGAALPAGRERPAAEYATNLEAIVASTEDVPFAPARSSRAPLLLGLGGLGVLLLLLGWLALGGRSQESTADPEAPELAATAQPAQASAADEGAAGASATPSEAAGSAAATAADAGEGGAAPELPPAGVASPSEPPPEAAAPASTPVPRATAQPIKPPPKTSVDPLSFQ